MPKVLTDLGVPNIEDFGAGVGDPLDFGFKTWNMPLPYLQANGMQPGSNGQIFFAKIKVARPTLVSNLHVGVTAAGATLTSGQNLMALYSGAKSLLATTADQSTAWGSTGFKTAAVTPTTIAAGFAYVALFTNASTRPTFLRGGSGVWGNGVLGVADYWFGVDATNTGRTTSMPATLGTFAQTTLGHLWVAVS